IEILLSSVYPEFDTLDIADKQYVVESFSAPIRKAAHFGEFSALGALFLVFFETFDFFSEKKYLILPIVLGFLYAISDEVHQLFVPGRACRITDIYIDSCGVLAGVIFLFLIYRGEWDT
ncbi:MAG: VanZ family protein, partial [Clostridia bacterium]|nr:VanZ family protein [Clostridia bacterium]